MIPTSEKLQLIIQRARLVNDFLFYRIKSMACNFLFFVLQIKCTQLRHHYLFGVKLIESFRWPDKGSTKLADDANGRFFYCYIWLFVGFVVVSQIIDQWNRFLSLAIFYPVTVRTIEVRTYWACVLALVAHRLMEQIQKLVSIQMIFHFK